MISLLQKPVLDVKENALMVLRNMMKNSMWQIRVTKKKFLYVFDVGVCRPFTKGALGVRHVDSHGYCYTSFLVASHGAPRCTQMHYGQARWHPLRWQYDPILGGPIGWGEAAAHDTMLLGPPWCHPYRHCPHIGRSVVSHAQGALGI